MKIETFTITYGVKRCQNYQSVDISMTVEATPGEGQTTEEVFGEAMKAMVPLVDREADAAIRDILAQSSRDH